MHFTELTKPNGPNKKGHNSYNSSRLTTNPRCTGSHDHKASYKVSTKVKQNCRSGWPDKIVSTDGRTDGRTD